MGFRFPAILAAALLTLGPAAWLAASADDLGVGSRDGHTGIRCGGLTSFAAGTNGTEQVPCTANFSWAASAGVVAASVAVIAAAFPRERPLSFAAMAAAALAGGTFAAAALIAPESVGALVRSWFVVASLVLLGLMAILARDVRAAPR